MIDSHAPNSMQLAARFRAEVMADLYGERGYSTAFSINAAELAFLRDAISKQWIARIEAMYPTHAKAFRDGGLEKYHTSSHLIAHETLWNKEYRIFPRDVVARVARFDSIERLMLALGSECRISKVIFYSGDPPDHPEVIWRLVRPNVATDVGAVHTDKWFERLLNDGKGLYSEDETTVKMWLAVHVEPGLSGLYVVPGSHRKVWRMKYVPSADGFGRPALDETLAGYDLSLVPTKPGQAVLFNEDLLHGGAINRGQSCRVSVEITFILKRFAINP